MSQHSKTETMLPISHPDFEGLFGRLELIRAAADALKGLGSMLQPEYIAGDEKMISARRGDAAAVFRFFGEALSQPAQEAYDEADRLDRAVRGVKS